MILQNIVRQELDMEIVEHKYFVFCMTNIFLRNLLLFTVLIQTDGKCSENSDQCRTSYRCTCSKWGHLQDNANIITQPCSNVFPCPNVFSTSYLHPFCAILNNFNTL